MHEEPFDASIPDISFSKCSHKTRKFLSCFNYYDDAFSVSGRCKNAHDSQQAVCFSRRTCRLSSCLHESRSQESTIHITLTSCRILYAYEIQFRRMFRVSRNVFDSLLEDLSLHLSDGGSHNTEQNIPASLKLGVALYYMAHGGDAIHLEAASEATALKYLHRVAELICTHLACKWMGESILKENGLLPLIIA